MTACGVGGLVVYGVWRLLYSPCYGLDNWALTADRQTRKEVATAVNAAFIRARESAPHELNDARREATFQVPHELARLNKDVPDFRLEDLGPMVHANLWLDRISAQYPNLLPFIDCGKRRVSSFISPKARPRLSPSLWPPMPR